MGILIDGTGRYVLEENITNNITATGGSGIGVQLSSNVTNITVRDSISIGNSTTGFEDLSPMVSKNTFFGNYAEANPTAGYMGIPGSIVTFTKMTGTFSAPPNRWTNIDAV